MRPLVDLAVKAATFRSSVTISRGTESVDAKNRLGVLLLTGQPGPVTLVAEGDDAGEAVRALAKIIRDAVEDVLRREREAK